MTGSAAQPLSLAVLICVAIFPIAHFLWRKRPNPPTGAPTSFAPSDAIRMIITGSGVPQAVCLLVWPIWPEALEAITDLPLLLLPTGFVFIVVALGDVFDWK